MPSFPEAIQSTIHGARAANEGAASGEASPDSNSDPSSSAWEHQLQGDAHQGSESIEMALISSPSPLRYQQSAPVQQVSLPPRQSSSENDRHKLDDFQNMLKVYHGSGRTKPPSFPSENELVDKNNNPAMLTSWHHETWKTWPKDAKNWDFRNGEAVAIADLIKDGVGEPSASASHDGDPDQRLFVYSLGEAPIAFMQTDRRSATATGMSPTAHPGGSGAGTALLEAAVNDSQQRGLGGKLQVSPYPSAEAFYERSGFEPETANSGKWELDPEPSVLWQHQSNKWSYALLNEKGYLASQTSAGNPLDYNANKIKAAVSDLRPSSNDSSSISSFGSTKSGLPEEG